MHIYVAHMHVLVYSLFLVKCIQWFIVSHYCINVPVYTTWIDPNCIIICKFCLILRWGLLQRSQFLPNGSSACCDCVSCMSIVISKKVILCTIWIKFVSLYQIAFVRDWFTIKNDVWKLVVFLSFVIVVDFLTHSFWSYFIHLLYWMGKYS